MELPFESWECLDAQGSVTLAQLILQGFMLSRAWQRSRHKVLSAFLPLARGCR